MHNRNPVKFVSVVIGGFLAICMFQNCNSVSFAPQTEASKTGGDGTTSITNPPPPPPPTSLPITLGAVNQIAYEDLEGVTNPDYDYNDFLTGFVVNETVLNGNVTRIVIDFYPRAVGAGDDHKFVLSINGNVTTPAQNNTSASPLPVSKPMVIGGATVTLTYYNYGQTTPTSGPTLVDGTQDIVLFASTHGAFGQAASAGTINTSLPAGYTSGVPSNYMYATQNVRVEIVPNDPTKNPAPAGGAFDSSTLRAVLYNINTNSDIDIINVGTNNFANNASDASYNGYPWGFIIPTDWQWMQEGKNIRSGYDPLISDYASYLLGNVPATATAQQIANWFVAPGSAQDLYPAVPFTAFMPAP